LDSLGTKPACCSQFIAAPRIKENLSHRIAIYLTRNS
jgi:hypothetical protein